jgi:signal transduction histidine kinase
VFRSIRWRLAASYAALILLSVSLMGALALLVVGRHVQRQEREFLAANAAAVAVQAGRFLEPQVRRIALEELAFTSAFLGDARVRILGKDGTVIADSGDPGAPDEFLWVIPSGLAEIDTRRRGTAPFIMPLPPARARGELPDRPREMLHLLGDLPLGTSHLFARRILTPWGKRFEFGEDFRAPPPGAPPRPRLPAVRLRSIRLPVGEPARPIGFVEMASPLSPSGEVIATMRGAILLSGLGSLVVAVAFGLLMGKTIADPLRGLAQVARRMAGGDLAARASDARRDEIGGLARQFNSMAESLEGSFRDLRAERDSLRRFIADASHELRTPLTALATFNELLQGSAAEDAAVREEFLRESAAQLKRLEWITVNLLDLSRLDAGIASLDIGEHEAADILQEAAAGFRVLATEKGMGLELGLPASPLPLTCDRDRMVLALSNLIANSVKFTQPGGAVSAGVGPVEGGVRFVVRDTGPGIDADELPRVFERFYRGRNAATHAADASGGVEGAGLGLSIVQSVARAHGGQVRVESTPGVGSTFIVEIPARLPSRLPLT